MMAGTPGTARGAALASKGRSICQRAWAVAIRVLCDDTGGIDDAKLASGYAAPHQRGSRMVRNLWHLPF
jgi:hypothetical protein